MPRPLNDLAGLCHTSRAHNINSARAPIAKTAAVLDLSDPQEQRKFLEYLQRSDVYGHRSQRTDSLLEEQRLYSALDALKRGKLKGYEQGFSADTRDNIIPQRLSKTDTDMLGMELLKETPNNDIVKSIADKYKTDENTIKREFLKSRYGQIKAWLKNQKNPEEERRATRVLAPGSAKLISNYMVVPNTDLVRKGPFMPTRSLTEMPARMVPNFLLGGARVRQTR